MAANTVEEYISQFDDAIQSRLEALRAIVHTEVPEAIESVSYGLIGYKLNNKPLVYFGGFKNHVGLYATPNGHEKFKNEFKKYKQGKGSVQFPLSQPLPVRLVKKVVIYRKEQVQKSMDDDSLPPIGRPAKRALAMIGVTKASHLKKYTEQEVLALHGMGPKAIGLLKKAHIKFKE